jgi:hypothetical protein
VYLIAFFCQFDQILDPWNALDVCMYISYVSAHAHVCLCVCELMHAHMHSYL